TFFFQAEDVIRDRNVTGVQTCALPICQAFQTMVHKIFTGGGKGIAQIATRAQLFRTTREARRWAIGAGLDPHALPKDLSAHQWVELFQAGKTPRKEGRRK